MRLTARLEGMPDRVVLWLSRRHPQTLPFRLTYRRIYVLPSGAGIGFALTLLVMLVGAINYNLSLGYALVFALFGVGHSATLQAFRNLLGVSIQGLRIDPVFAGEAAILHVLIGNPTARERPAIVARCGASESRATLPAASEETIELALPTSQRGWMPVGRIHVGTTWPLGLVRAWSVLRPELACLVYPAPESSAPPLPTGVGNEAAGLIARRTGDDDFAGLRPHRLSDSPRHVAWKAAASGGPLLTKEFAAQESASLLLDWNALYGLEDDSRAARLTAWVLAAESRGLRYALRTPEGLLGAGSGAHHLHTCLSRLALARSRHDAA